MSQYLDRSLSWIAQNVLNTFDKYLAILGIILTLMTLNRLSSALVFLSVVAFAALIYYARKNYLRRAYFVFAAARDDKQVQGMLGNTERYFRDTLGIPKASQHWSVTERDGYNEAKWQKITDKVVQNLNRVQGEYDKIHFASYAPLACNFLLGTKLANRYPLEVYQYHNNFYSVWNTDESLRDRQPIMDSTSTVCDETIQLIDVADSEGGMRACAVALNIGTVDALPSMQAYVQKEMPDISLWAISREGYLPSDKPEQWLMIAQEIISELERISHTGKFDLYLFLRMPSSLALMVGAGLAGLNRRIHFLQDEDDTYREVLEIRT